MVFTSLSLSKQIQTLTGGNNKDANKKKRTLRLYFITNTIQLTMSTKTTGTVKFFNADKGFGFIKHDDSNKETFVHASGLIDQVKENDHVEFDLQNGKKGLNAVNVKLI
jgi:cold shock protein